MKTFAITTFGCQMNHSDSERVAAVCKSMGYVEAKETDIADLYVINTCSIRQKAEDRVLGMGKKFFKFKNERTNIKTVLTGCMAKRDIRQGKEKSEVYQEKYEGKLLKQMPWLDYVVEIADIHKLPDILGETVENKSEDYFAVKPKYNSKFQAFVPISTGCNKFCTFCIVPFTRGKEVYRSFEQIYAEVKDLVDKGYKEITLLGQNVNSWKSEVTVQDQIPITKLREELRIKNEELRLENERLSGKSEESSKLESVNSLTLEPGDSSIGTLANSQIPNSSLSTTSMDFTDLMEKLADIPGEFWLRFTSSHPYDINPRLIDVVAKKDNIAKQFHFALQSGSNTVLKRMNRYYTSSEFKEKVIKIKEMIPEVGVTTDIIVGFCGETDAEFEDTAKIMEELQFDQAFISEYSQRAGTIAAKFYKDDISRDVKRQRKEALDAILKHGLEESNKKLIGTEQKVLVIKSKIKNKEGIFARTTQAKDVLIRIENEELGKKGVEVGQFVNVKVVGFRGFCLEGEVI